MSERSLHWFSTGGGPPLLVPELLLQDWSGIDVGDDSRSDYDRACELTGQLASLAVGSGEGLVLGDEPLDTAYLPRSGGGVLVRWLYAKTENRLLEHLNRLTADPEPEELAEFHWNRGRLMLIDSACPGPEVGTDRLVLNLKPGRYVAQAARVEFDAETAAVLVTLKVRRPGRPR